MPEPKKIIDPETLKALAHPMRQRLLGLLHHLGPSTVGTLADKVDGDPGQVSYHLRKLHEAGFIEEAPEASRDFRQRWWKPVMESHSWSSRDFPTPAARAVADAATRQWIIEQFQALREHHRLRHSYPPQWQDAATGSQSYLNLSAPEVSQMVEEFQALCERWSRYSEDVRATGDPDRRPVRFFYHVFPENL
ncbi:MAG TPA: helix-turn-helix domain-containing protein [Stackebrandtia sp.]|jgi:DNA-binding transcriptional ArsR family regulator|uniref:winged helix-turn-helix domain-containing protein n=1 Tax=Stackebrandtia sp. TaxID=2023065 RepID=UPI002D66C7A7|nr:helix-turn-helix domain-containing protein [Stackebrandtia sp.]HZE39399.1 helix-turn-helix domain-containing protein [Stackebrandtia sp.]